jgi:methylthioribose-1-phosphate isomerase
VTVSADAAAAHLMKSKGITWVIVGAERIAANGDIAGPIGTYQLAVCAMHHGVRFMVVASSAAIDLALESGEDIPLLERDGRELLEVAGTRIGADVDAFNPIHDVTPADLIDVIVTEKGIVDVPSTPALNSPQWQNAHFFPQERSASAAAPCQRLDTTRSRVLSGFKGIGV